MTVTLLCDRCNRYYTGTLQAECLCHACDPEKLGDILERLQIVKTYAGLVRCQICGRYGWHKTERCPEVCK
jgi:hypothetical protein